MLPLFPEQWVYGMQNAIQCEVIHMYAHTGHQFGTHSSLPQLTLGCTFAYTNIRLNLVLIGI